MSDTTGAAAPASPSGPQSRLERPVVPAILESQPVPALLFVADGNMVLPNRPAQRFITMTPSGPAVLASDGTNLWTIIEARSDEAAPFYDVRVRLRTDDGEAAETTMSVVPVRGSSGELAAAMVFVLHVAGERLSAIRQSAINLGGLQNIVEQAGKLIGADRMYVLEFDRDESTEAVVRAYWCSDDEPLTTPSFRLHGTPSASFGGKRVVCVPSGVESAFEDHPLIRGHEAYVGIALTDGDGHQIGCLAGLWKQALGDASGLVATLTISSAWASRALLFDIARRELLESEQRYGALFEGSLVPMLLVEPTTTQIVDANPAACELYGFPRDEFLTMSILQVEALSVEVVQSEIERAAAGTRGHFVDQHMLSGGRLRDVEITIGPITVGGRRLLYCMINDVTERRRMEAELERRKRSLELTVGQRTEDLLRANSELQLASMTRDLVLVNLAQELRTSLQTITGFSELLLGGMAGELSSEQRRQVEMVQEAGTRLGEFATALAESRRVQNAEPLEHAEEFDVVGLVESVVTGLGLFAQDKGITLRFEAVRRPIIVRTDRYKVQQILLNLLSNGIRYTDEGSVTASVAQDERAETAIAVSDTGTGLAAEAVAGLFSDPDMTFPKAGIGLPSSQRIARELGGSIDVLSVEGAGSTFTLRLPAPDRPEHTVEDSDD